MGYPMALNLQAGLGQDKTLLICDTNLEALDRFQAEARGTATVKIVSNGFEAAKAAVRNIPPSQVAGHLLTTSEYSFYHAARVWCR